ncbi:hypothetical protein V1514DRAFT_369508 [Lipomyces japonicus]|uniref:uncharacterized protein n=1 Tax=Lipomyces japonicus TaxID=56871 RepID=UPI0034CE191A
MSFHNFVQYINAAGSHQVGHLDLEDSSVTPLAFASGTPIASLYDVISTPINSIIAQKGQSSFPLSNVKLLPPLASRDVLAVGKNYYDHAREFNQSGFDSSDKVDVPSDPVLFTKRFTSIIPSGAEIYLDPDFTSTLDFEGEVGVIIGKPARNVAVESALDYVWGYTIVNDVTARERQRDHKQFFIGKSGDTYCPMGPIAVPKINLPEFLSLKTFVNGKLRQDDSTENLIFNVPTLINVLSTGITLQPGDVIATGTPAGVGIGLVPPLYLKPGDQVDIEVTGLGKLSNRIVPIPQNHTISLATESVYVPAGLTKVGSKYLYVEDIGNHASGKTVICVHGLGASAQYFETFINRTSIIKNYRVLLVDNEGFGSSRSSPTSILSIESFANDLFALVQAKNITGHITLIGHSMGCGISELFANTHPELVDAIILMSPLHYPLAKEISGIPPQLEIQARQSGLQQLANNMSAYSVSKKTLAQNPVAITYIQSILKVNDPDNYAKGCNALTRQEPIGHEHITQPVLLITGEEDEWPSLDVVKKVASELPNSTIKIMKDCSHWHILENFCDTVAAVEEFLQTINV